MQGARVGVPWRAEKVGDGGGLDDASGIHDHHAVAEAGDNAEVVRNEDDGHAELALEFFNQLKDLRLDGDIEGRGGFVGDEYLRFGDEGHRDHDPLSHAAGEFVGIAVEAVGGVVDTDGFHHGECAGKGVAAGDFFVYEQWLDELLADPHVGIERGHRVLENHADAFASDGSKLGIGGAQQVGAVEFRAGALDAGGRAREEAEQGSAGDGLAGARFSDQTERLAALEGKTHAVDGAEDGSAGVKGSAEVLDIEERHCVMVGEPWPSRRAGASRHEGGVDARYGCTSR